jgi:hypothetical protein
MIWVLAFLNILLDVNEEVSLKDVFAFFVLLCRLVRFILINKK